MESSNSDILQFISDYSEWIAAIGVFLYLGVMICIIRGWLERDSVVVRVLRIVVWAMLLAPVGLHIYFSQYVVLWSSLLLCAIGVIIVVKRKLGQ